MVTPMTDILTVRFLAACKNGNLDSAKRNLDSSEINTKGEGNNTGLMLASAGGKHHVVNFLLTVEDVDVNLTNTDGRSALMLAANKRHIKIVKMLLEREDTNIDVEDKWKMKAEDLASMRSYTDIVNLIKEAMQRRDDNFFRVYEDVQPEEDRDTPVYATVQKVTSPPEPVVATGELVKKESFDLIDLNIEVKSNIEKKHYDNIELITAPIPAKRAVRPASMSLDLIATPSSPTTKRKKSRCLSMRSSDMIPSSSPINRNSRPVSMKTDLIPGSSSKERTGLLSSSSTSNKNSRAVSLRPGMIPSSSAGEKDSRQAELMDSRKDGLMGEMVAGSGNSNGEANIAVDVTSGARISKRTKSRSRSASPQLVPSLVELCTPVAEQSTTEDEHIMGRWLTRVLSGEEAQFDGDNKSEIVETREKQFRERKQSFRDIVTQVQIVNDLEVKEIDMDAINEDLSSKTREHILKKIDEVNLLLVKAEKEFVPSKVVEMNQKKEIADRMAIANTERKQLYSRQANEKKQFERKQKIDKNELFANQKINIDKIKEKFKIDIDKAKMQEKKITQYQDMIGDMVEKLSQLENQVLISQTKNKSNKSGRSISELECPVCLEEMRPPVRIWQCKDGHALCDNCKQNPRIKKCPTCRGPFMGRATILEKVALSIFNTE